VGDGERDERGCRLAGLIGKSPSPEVKGSGTDGFASAECLNRSRLLLESLEACDPFLSFAVGHEVVSKELGDPSKLLHSSITPFTGCVQSKLSTMSTNPGLLRGIFFRCCVAELFG
jgi:hypothetical protein